ncbi:hypothetical protein C8255_13005, partial [filamentous cyanobacterium CCP3]
VLSRNQTHELTFFPAAGYSFYTASGIAADFRFDLDVNGQIILDPRYAGFATASGQTLTLTGYHITIDGSALSHDLLFQNILGNSDVLSRNQTHELTFLPAAGYSFYTASGIAANFRFDLNVSGQIILDPRYAGFATASGQTLTLTGYRITIDGHTLSHDLAPISLLGNQAVLPRDQVHELTFLPAAGYSFYTASGIAADFRFDLNVSGQVILDPRYTGFATATNQTLTLSGYRITIDGRTLSHDLAPVSLLGNQAVLPRDQTHELTFLPAAGYSFYTASGIAANFRFDLDVAGQIILDPRYAGFATASGQTLTLSGYRITIDGHILSHDLAPISLLGNQAVLPRDQTHELTFLPAAGYSFYTASGIAADFRFDLDVNGQVIIDPRYTGFATASSQTLTLSGYRITIDGRALSTDLAPISLLGNQTVLPRGQTHELTYLPAAGYTFQSAQDIPADFRFDISTDGRVVVASRFADFTQANGSSLIFRTNMSPNPDQSRTFQVVGKVTSDTLAVVDRLQVAIVDKNIGSDVTVSETLTDSEGNYSAAFTYAGQKQKPDLQIRVSRDGVLLGASEVRYNAANNETLNITVESPIDLAPTSEYETLLSAISQHFTGNLQDLQETGDRQDITYLANKTGLDAQSITLASLADQFSSNTIDASGSAAIQPAAFYSLFREGLPADEVALYQTDAQKVKDIWNKGIEQHIIPAELEGQIPQAIDQFQQLGVERLLRGAPSPQGIVAAANPARELLALSLGQDDAQIQKFAELKIQHGSNPPIFWEQVRAELGNPTERRLQLDNQLASLTLNNVPLIQKLHDQSGVTALNGAIVLVSQGFYQADKWQEVMGTDTPIPAEIAGETDAEKRSNYYNLLADQIRLNYPTAVIAQMIETEQIALTSPAAPKQDVVAFLQAHQETFEFGTEPIAKYLSTYRLTQTPELETVIKEIERIQRLYQITPTDEALHALSKTQGLDSAYAVVNYGRESFVKSFKDDMGGEVNAQLAYAKAEQVYNTTLNLAMSYQVARTAPTLGSDARGLVLNPAPNIPVETAANAGDVIAYPTLEGLFGELDYCACDHCRSFLSPAAYLVDLLTFIDPNNWQQTIKEWKLNHDGAPYPFDNQDSWQRHRNTWARKQYGVEGWDNLTSEQQLKLLSSEIPPLEVLLSRRPDIQHLPLTCENTNGVVPHIDLVNETLEYFVIHNLKLDDYQGHSTEGDATPEELLASPQFVSTAAYDILAGNAQPGGSASHLLSPAFPLPFHQPLENLRRYFDRFEAPLPKVMEALRRNEDLDRASETEYAWRDILLEELRISLPEYDLLADNSKPLTELFGFLPEISEDEVLRKLSNAKAFTRRLGITYEDIVAIIQTQFINPSAALLPKLERLRVGFADLKALKDSGATGQAWLDLLPEPLPDASKYGGNIEAWVKDESNFEKVIKLITLADPTNGADLCSFDPLEFRYANPDTPTALLSKLEFIKLIRFIRLWKKLGWSIEQTDKAITALYPADQTPNDSDEAVNLQRLDAGFKSLLLRLGVLKQVIEALSLNPDRDLLRLLSCFAPIDTHGAASLYRQMFLSSALLKQNQIFADDGYGNYLQKLEVSYSHTQPALEQPILDAAANQLIYNDARKQLSFQGILTATTRDALRAVPGVEQVFQEAIAQLYVSQRLFANVEILKAELQLADEQFSEIVQRLLLPTDTLRAAFQLTDEEFSAIVTALPDNSTLIDRDEENIPLLTLKNISAVFRRGWLAHKLKLSIREFLLLIQITKIDPFLPPDAPNPQILNLIRFVDRLRSVSFPLEQALYLIWNQDISGKSAPPESTILQFARTLRTDFATIASEFTRVDDPDGKIARDQMALAYGNETTDFFFGLLNQTLVTSVQYDHPQEELEQAIQNAGSGRISYDSLRKELSFTGVLSQEISDALKTANPGMQQAIDDLFEQNQKTISPFFERYPELEQLYNAYIGSDASVNENEKRSRLLENFLPKLQEQRKRQQALQAISAVAKIDLGFASTLLDSKLDQEAEQERTAQYVLHAADSTQPALNDLIAIEADVATASSSWDGYLEAPETGFYNFRVETSNGTTITFTLDGKTHSNGRNNKPIELVAGTLYPLSMQASNVQSTLRVRWQTSSRGWEAIPQRYLYSRTQIDHFRIIYIRFLKCISLSAGLKLSANELAYLATYPDKTQSWLNQLLTAGNPTSEISETLLQRLTDLLDFSYLKSKLQANDEQLLAVIKDPEESNQRTDQNTDSLLYSITQWDSRSLNTLLSHFGKTIANLNHIETFRRVYDVFGWLKQMGISGSALIQAVTNEPNASTVNSLQSALRARYDEQSWLSVLKPINDEMRGLQRDALVTYILHQLQANPDTAHINTPEKLFEYFLMDVQMEPCMQTSRIRHALSSVQLFIERSLMNLEPRVCPSTITSQEWEWKKRYRLWEANRKVFLYPENWLEPELRDDQSPFFKEAMSELLQSDITEERAAIVLLNYLSKLDEVAKLEPCGIHVVEGGLGTNDDVVHVVARTFGANRKYYYRRKGPDSWTPWEYIKLDIEDNPVVPFVWKGRTFLFWLRILKQASQKQQQQQPLQADNNNQPLSEIRRGQVNLASSPTMDVQLILCWSEYYNGKWQPTKTSDINNPALLVSCSFQAFDRLKCNLGIYEESDKLKIWVTYPNLMSGVLFYIRNTHSSPIISLEKGDLAQHLEDQRSDFSSPARWLSVSGDPADLILGATTRGNQNFESFPIIQNKFFDYHIIEPQHLLRESLYAPFFYEDNNHVFYVTTERRKVTRNFKTIITDDKIFYVVTDTGKLLWFKDDEQDGTNAPNGSTGWNSRSGSRISQGWQEFEFLVSGGNGIIYAVKSTGEMLFYQDIFYNDELREGTHQPIDIQSFTTNPPSPNTGWHVNSGKQISQGWQNLKFLLSGGGGIIYGILTTGEVLFFEDLRRDGSNTSVNVLSKRVGPLDRATGWHQNTGKQIGYGAAQEFKHWFGGGNGILYAVKLTGELLFYQDIWKNGENAANGSTGWHQNSGKQIGTGWQGFKFLTSGGDGIIYAVKPTGELGFYQDLRKDGTNSVGINAWKYSSFRQINLGWT